MPQRDADERIATQRCCLRKPELVTKNISVYHARSVKRTPVTGNLQAELRTQKQRLATCNL
ncbi:MAG: hypothetical protein JWQ40_2611 [Segetibacter sp.]|nr:hypothetical protein [Segetibacter sp.]